MNHQKKFMEEKPKFLMFFQQNFSELVLDHGKMKMAIFYYNQKSYFKVIKGWIKYVNLACNYLNPESKQKFQI